MLSRFEYHGMRDFAVVTIKSAFFYQQFVLKIVAMTELQVLLSSAVLVTYVYNLRQMATLSSNTSWPRPPRLTLRKGCKTTFIQPLSQLRCTIFCGFMHNNCIYICLIKKQPLNKPRYSLFQEFHRIGIQSMKMTLERY